VLAVYSSTSQGLNAGATRASAVKLVPITVEENEAGIPQSRQITHSRFLSADTFCRTGRVSLKFAVGTRELSSQAGASSTKVDDDDLEGGLSELEIQGSNDESDADLSDEDEDGGKPVDEMDLSDADPTKKKSQGRRTQSELFKAIANAPGLSVDSALNKWVEHGKELSRKEILLAVRELRRRKMYGRAFQVKNNETYICY